MKNNILRGQYYCWRAAPSKHYIKGKCVIVCIDSNIANVITATCVYQNFTYHRIGDKHATWSLLDNNPQYGTWTLLSEQEVYDIKTDSIYSSLIKSLESNK